MSWKNKYSSKLILAVLYVVISIVDILTALFGLIWMAFHDNASPTETHYIGFYLSETCFVFSVILIVSIFSFLIHPPIKTYQIVLGAINIAILIFLKLWFYFIIGLR